MTVKMRHLARWKKMGIGLNLPGKLRVVELELNVDVPTRFDVEHGKDVTFLTVVQPGGPVRVQFAVEGDCTVLPTSYHQEEGVGEVWYFTDDGEILNFEVTTPSFTELEQRMDTTPEMEVVILKAHLREEQRKREVAELLLRKKQREEARAADADPETGEVTDGEPVGAYTAAPEGGEGAGGSTPRKA
ncbi:MAG TPA: hypothetical protein VIL88_12080 [Devosia sp.]|jgi:hypothetical protein|uniref:hypothetical protein n=1 Tax=Devosia sp. TaxID=1871048 RepID=UPI002F94412B